MLLGVSGGLAAIATVVPPLALVTLPALGVLTLSQALVGLATFIGGWATRTPGHVAGDGAKRSR